MHLKVFLKLKKTLKSSLLSKRTQKTQKKNPKKTPKKPKKPQKKPKNPKKTSTGAAHFFANPDPQGSACEGGGEGEKIQPINHFQQSAHQLIHLESVPCTPPTSVLLYPPHPGAPPPILEAFPRPPYFIIAVCPA
jgi:hypothetical protein